VIENVVKCWLKARLKLAKSMYPDMVFYYPVLRSVLLTSVNLYRNPEILAKTCGVGVASEDAIREIYIVDELLSAEDSEHIEFLDIYVNELRRYDDPARIRMLKDML
jgi:hypothetical protein